MFAAAVSVRRTKIPGGGFVSPINILPMNRYIKSRGFGQDVTSDVMAAEYYTPSPSDLATYQGSSQPTIITPQQIASGYTPLTTSGAQPSGGILNSLISAIGSVGSALVPGLVSKTGAPSPAPATGIRTIVAQPAGTIMGIPTTYLLIGGLGLGALFFLKGRRK